MDFDRLKRLALLVGLGIHAILLVLVLINIEFRFWYLFHFDPFLGYVLPLIIGSVVLVRNKWYWLNCALIVSLLEWRFIGIGLASLAHVLADVAMVASGLLSLPKVQERLAGLTGGARPESLEPAASVQGAHRPPDSSVAASPAGSAMSSAGDGIYEYRVSVISASITDRDVKAGRAGDKIVAQLETQMREWVDQGYELYRSEAFSSEVQGTCCFGYLKDNRKSYEIEMFFLIFRKPMV
jgi:hypothetical protein